MRPRGLAAVEPLSFVAALLVVASASVSGQAGKWSFENAPAGRPPPGFAFAGSPNHAAGLWLVVRDGTMGVLAHAQPDAAGAQLAIAEATSFSDLMVSARLRFPATAGSAGVAWRYRDANNYYFAALDLRAQNVRIYRVVGGNRTRLEDEDDLELDPALWHTVKVEQRGNRIRVWIDGVPVAGARDRTTLEPGAIGFWTAGDATVWFDDLHAEPLPESARSNRRE